MLQISREMKDKRKISRKRHLKSTKDNEESVSKKSKHEDRPNSLLDENEMSVKDSKKANGLVHDENDVGNVETTLAGAKNDDKRSISDENMSLFSVLNLIKVQQTRYTGLQKMLQLLKQGNAEGTSDVVKKYLKMSPECKEYFHIMEAEERPSAQVAKLVWEIFENILLVSSDNENSLQSSGLYIINRILNKHLKQIYSSLSSSTPADLTKAVLRLLTAIIAQGKHGVSELLASFDFTLKALESLSKRRDRKAKTDVRTCFIRFCLAFLVFGDTSSVKQVLELQVLSNGIFNGLLKDPPENVYLVLSTFTDKVIKRSGLLKKTKIAFFNSHNLMQLAQLYVSYNGEGKDENEETAEIQNAICVMVIEILTALCTNVEYGICFKSKQGELTGRSNNPVLLKFLRSLQKVSKSESKMQDLISQTLSTSHDLIIPFISTIGINLEPRMSSPWVNNINFLTKIWSSLPTPYELLQNGGHIISSSNLQTVMKWNFPSILNKTYLVNGLKQSSLTVKQKTIEIILICMRRTTSIISFIRSMEHCNALKRSTVEEQFLDLVIKHLPEANVVVAARQSLISGSTKKDKDETQKGNVSDNIEGNVEVEDLDALIIELMNYYQQIRPGILSDSQFNISKLFTRETNDDYFNSSLLLYSCEIANMEPRGALKWFSKKSDTYSNAMQMIFNAYLMTKSTDIKLVSKSLIIKLLEETGNFNEHLNEIDAWLEVLLLTFEETNDMNLANYFYHICAIAVNHFYSIIDELTEIMAESVADLQSTKTGCRYENVERLELSPFVVGALRYFVKTVTGNEEKENLGAMTRFITWFLKDALMSQPNPLCLFTIIDKYTKLISDHKCESSWINDWLDLNDFACKWSTGLGLKVKGNFESKCSLKDNIHNNKKGSSFPSIIRELFPLTPGYQKGFQGDNLCDFKTRVKSSLSHRSSEGKLTTVDVQIILNCFKNIDEISTNTNILKELCLFFGNLIKDCFKLYQERLKSKPRKASQHGDKEHQKLDAMFSLVLQFHVFQKNYLAGNERFSNWLTELLEVILNSTREPKIIEIACDYLKMLSTSFKSFTHDDNVKADCNEEEILKALRLFAKCMPLEQCRVLISDIIAACKSTKCNRKLFVSALTVLINGCNDSWKKDIVQKSQPESSSIEDNSNLFFSDSSTAISMDFVPNDPSELCDTCANDFEVNFDQRNRKRAFITLQNQHFKDLFSLLMKNQNSTLDTLVLDLLKMDRTKAVLAPLSLLDSSFMTSPNRIDIARCLVQASPLHARHMVDNIGRKDYIRDLYGVLPILHGLLFNSNQVIQRQTVKYLQSKINSLVSLMTNEDAKGSQNDSHYEVLVEILIVLCSSLEDKNAVTVQLFEMLEKISAGHVLMSSLKLKHQLELFDEIIIDDINVEGNEMCAVKTLPMLMKILELSVLKDGGNAFQEQEIIMHIMIRKLCSIISRKKSRGDYCLQPVFDLWSSWIKTILKNRFQDSSSISTIRFLVETLYSIKRFKMKSKIGLKKIYNYILSHSMFLTIMLETENNHNNKGAIIELLLSIAGMDSSVCEENHLKVFMAAYNATMSSKDQKLLRLLKVYEENGISVLSSRLLFWGNEGLKRHEDNHNQTSTLYNSPAAKEIMELIDRNMLLKSAYNFPLSLDIAEPNKDLALRDDIYDPAFFLPVFSFTLGPGLEIDCRKFIEIGCLSFVISATSCNQVTTRKSAYHILARFINHFDSARFREKKQVGILLDAFRNAIMEEGIQLPSVTCCFMIRCLQIILRADQQLYPVINNFVLQRPCLDIKDVPLLLPMLNSSNLQFTVERSWILKLLVSGLRTSADYYIYKKRHVFELLMSLYDSPICDNLSKKPIFDLFLAASKIHPAAFDLVKNYGLLSWLHSKLHSSEKHSLEFVVQILKNFMETFQHGFKKLNDDQGFDVKKPKLQNFPLECVLLCVTVLQTNSSMLTPAQVLSAVAVINWCLESSNDVVHTAVYVSRDNLYKLIQLCQRTVLNCQDVLTSTDISLNVMGIINMWLKQSILSNQQNLSSLFECIPWLLSVVLSIFTKNMFENQIIITVVDVARSISEIITSMHITVLLNKPSVRHLFHELLETLVSIEQPRIKRSLRSRNSRTNTPEASRKSQDSSESTKSEIFSNRIIDGYNVTVLNLNRLRFELYKMLISFISKNGDQEMQDVLIGGRKLVEYLEKCDRCGNDNENESKMSILDFMEFVCENLDCTMEAIMEKDERFIGRMEDLFMGIYMEKER